MSNSEQPPRKPAGIRIEGGGGHVIKGVRTAGYEVGVSAENTDRLKIDGLTHMGAGSALELKNSFAADLNNIVGYQLTQSQFDELIGVAKINNKDGFFSRISNLIKDIPYEKLDAAWSLATRAKDIL